MISLQSWQRPRACGAFGLFLAYVHHACAYRRLRLPPQVTNPRLPAPGYLPQVTGPKFVPLGIVLVQPHQTPLPQSMSQSPGESIARRAAALASELKASDIVVLDLRGVTDMTDFFVIASGTSDTHVRAVAEHIQAGLKDAGVSTTMTEGLTQGRWALLDYTDCVIHVFHPTLRQFYQLERLWGDAKPVNLDPVMEGVG